MSVGFSQIPSDLRVPLFYAEVDNSAANTAQASLLRLIVGQVNDDATHEDIGRLTLVSRSDEAASIGGVGSVLHRMHELFRRNDPFGEIWCLPVKITEGVAATGRVSLEGSVTAAGLINLYIAGQRVQVTASLGVSAEVLAGELATAINAAGRLPVKASAAAGVVSLTAKFKGELGNDIQLQINRLGRSGGETTPAGLTVTLDAMSGGAGSPDLAQVLAALGDEPFEFIVQPWTDAASLTAWREVMGDVSGRWSWAQQLYGHVYTASRGALGELVAAGRQRNDQHLTLHGFEQQVPQPCWEVAAAYCARQAVFISADPGRPTQTGELVGIEPAPKGARFLLSERQSLLTSGVATAYTEGGAYRIERAVTTYQKNAFGQPDDSYLDSEPLHLSAHVLRTLRTRITSKFPRHKVAHDGTRFGPGQAIVTPKVIRGELLACYRELERDGLVENYDLFAQHLIVERAPSNPNRINVLFPPDLINQLRVFALLYQFRHQYPDAA